MQWYDISNEVNHRETYLLHIIHAAMNEDKLFSIADHSLTVVAQYASYVQSAVRSYYNITTDVFWYKNSVDGLNSDSSLVKLPLSDNSNATSNFVSRIRTARVRQNPRLNVLRHIEFTSQLPQPPLIATTLRVLMFVRRNTLG
ncbi:hypothetical protein V6N12_033076 [Hibiscus sabdariffa]|uniref:Plastocyanin-like domain-containing protein n=1 Tax=Hibiscus sabdariffa TaxID=183260 RepID=A0ABR2BD73_9ROSI